MPQWEYINTLRWHITPFWEAVTKTLYGQGTCMLPDTAQIIPNVGMILAYNHILSVYKINE